MLHLKGKIFLPRLLCTLPFYLRLETQILASSLKHQPLVSNSSFWGSNPSLGAQIPALGLKSQRWGSILSIGTQISNSSLQAQF